MNLRYGQHTGLDVMGSTLVESWGFLFCVFCRHTISRLNVRTKKKRKGDTVNEAK